MNQFKCPDCSEFIEVDALLRAVNGYDRITRSSVALCPLCKEGRIFQIHTNEIDIGYIYSSGSAHFEGLFQVLAKGIRSIVDKDIVTYQFHRKIYEIISNEVGGANSHSIENPKEFKTVNYFLVLVRCSKLICCIKY